MDLLSSLNNKQKEAVTTLGKYTRVIAGAGSGKTRVLTYRIAYLIKEQDIKPWNILAITFTNKVANEMKQRLLELTPFESSSLHIKTFHSFASYFLRQEITTLGFPTSFTIMDEEDQTKLIKDIAVELGYSRKSDIVKMAVSFISSCKNKGQLPEDVSSFESFPEKKDCVEIFTRYEDEKNKMHCLDFDDLLLYTNKILSSYPNIRQKWQKKFTHILIDEFQDTNDVEYKLVKLMLSSESSLYVVGDPDQTIYTWRGANQKIIIDLDRDFKPLTTISLEQNYRSTQVILDSANKLISNNKLRIPKNLFTKNKSNEKIVVHPSLSSKDEASFVAQEIKRLKRFNNISYRDIAILYRSNYVTVDFESALTRLQIPYRIYGGVRFYQRREIKDVLAYFHLIVNSNDDISFLRALGYPRRGIGEISINRIKDEAKSLGLSLYEYASSVDEDGSKLSSKVINILKAFVKRIDLARIDIDKKEDIFSKTLEDLISEVGFYDGLSKEDDGDDRLENVKALFQDLRSYLFNNPESSFDEYLQNIALISAQDELEEGDFVSLMTVHTAKGLEFPVVFVVRLNNTIFPHNRAILEGGYLAMEEERRLAYVAFTRAKKYLYLSYCNGFSYVTGTSLSPSIFIKESGNASLGFGNYSTFLDENPYTTFEKAETKTKEIEIPDDKPKTNGILDWKVGDKLSHERLGKGVVKKVDGDGVLDVDFEDHGLKSIMGNHPMVKRL